MMDYSKLHFNIYGNIILEKENGKFAIFNKENGFITREYDNLYGLNDGRKASAVVGNTLLLINTKDEILDFAIGDSAKELINYKCVGKYKIKNIAYKIKKSYLYKEELSKRANIKETFKDNPHKIDILNCFYFTDKKYLSEINNLLENFIIKHKNSKKPITSTMSNAKYLDILNNIKEVVIPLKIKESKRLQLKANYDASIKNLRIDSRAEINKLKEEMNERGLK
jgi:hypothetical protein